MNQLCRFCGGYFSVADARSAALSRCVHRSIVDIRGLQAAAPAAARTHRAVPTSPPRTSSSCRTCTSMRYMLPLASSASRSHLHIAQTVPLQKVFSTACSGILCASSAPQAPPEAMSIVMSTDKTPSTGRKPGMARSLRPRAMAREASLRPLARPSMAIYQTASLALERLLLRAYRHMCVALDA